MKFRTILLFGDRNWDDQEVVDSVVFTFKRKYGADTLVEGEAKGADTCARLAGEKYGFIIKAFPAEWHKFGKGAGPIRNAQQLREGKPDFCCGFHDDLYNSKGSLDMAKKIMSSERNIPGIIVSHSKKDNPFMWVWFTPPVEGFTLGE